jgi:hypothetical protein
MLRSLLIACAVVACVSAPAMAQPAGLFFPGLWNAGVSQGYDRPRQRPYRARARGGYGTVIGGAPAGCRHLGRLYCGCASALYVKLRARWNVNLAANWIRYLPRAAPAPGMAAARRGHVKIITAVLGGGRYKFYDPNSGGGLTRITTGTLAGFVVVNPRGHRAYASAR